ncbi:MAG: hypothetical protein WCQ99_03425 [Pseudomonadota bacterium]
MAENAKITPTAKPTVLVRAGALIGIFLVHTTAWFLNFVGYQKTLVMGEKAGNIICFVFRRMKSRVMHNLNFALGNELSPAEQEELAHKVVKAIAKNWFELFFYVGPGKKTVQEHITVEGRENLDKALARGKGAIAVSAHLGNYPILAQQLSKKGYNFIMVIRDPKSRIESLIYADGRDHIDLHALLTTPERQFFKKALRVLHSNGVLCLIADENKRHGGIFVDFFGHSASTPPGPAALAVRTGAAIIPVFIVRSEDNSQRVIIEKEIAWNKSGDTESDMREITARFTKVIEDYVRRDLSQWMWANWRWRTQRGGQSNAAKLKKKKVFRVIKKIYDRM